MAARETVASLAKRLKRFEDEHAVKACMNCYMTLCDQLTVGFDLEPLLALFSEDAIWEGIGSRYSKTFGRMQGRSAIAEMFHKYTQPPAHFAVNVHFLTSELIRVKEEQATGHWVLLQTATFSDGRSQLSSARLEVDFICAEGEWQISHFRTESLFNRPVQTPWDQAAALPVPE
ncbi:nuclear transport factor 2 family protein [Neptuniibacter halophilus]|uniref:nuclear transport factor 2 family protein n=1 Tax=Neptuniibacter halophilus TaxID=651666 RepID=UPI0025725EED|nr:nuclear transport factor 2 family protein [Neptuniibacter halophilus]